jgi:hypothetical protein
VRGLTPPIAAQAPAVAPNVKPPLNRQKPGADAQLKLAPEALEYQNAKRMSEVTESKLNARTRQLQGSDLF